MGGGEKTDSKGEEMESRCVCAWVPVRGSV